jgi:hypothetical protein
MKTKKLKLIDGKLMIIKSSDSIKNRHKHNTTFLSAFYESGLQEQLEQTPKDSTDVINVISFIQSNIKEKHWNLSLNLVFSFCGENMMKVFNFGKWYETEDGKPIIFIEGDSNHPPRFWDVQKLVNTIWKALLTENSAEIKDTKSIDYATIVSITE